MTFLGTSNNDMQLSSLCHDTRNIPTKVNDTILHCICMSRSKDLDSSYVLFGKKNFENYDKFNHIDISFRIDSKTKKRPISLQTPMATIFLWWMSSSAVLARYLATSDLEMRPPLFSTKYASSTAVMGRSEKKPQVNRVISWNIVRNERSTSIGID